MTRILATLIMFLIVICGICGMMYLVSNPEIINQIASNDIYQMIVAFFTTPVG